MNKPRADALVFFGATGDLAYKKIFPALQAMARRGRLDVPVIGVAKSGWTLEQLVERARASRERGGDRGRRGVCHAGLATPLRRWRLRRSEHVRAAATASSTAALGPRTTWRFRRACFRPSSKACAMRTARRTPGSSSRSRSGAISSRRAGPEPDPAQRLRRRLHLPHRPLPRQGSRSEHPLLPVRELVPGTDLEPELRRERADHAG